MSWLKAGAFQNIFVMSVTLDVFQAEMLPLNDVLLNKLLMSVMFPVHQSWIGPQNSSEPETM